MTFGQGQKYKNSHTKVDGITFHSKVEAQRYLQLKMLAAAGKIFHLSIQPRFKIEINGCLICHYIADFMYTESLTYGSPVIIEDVKGFPTREFHMKWKLVIALYAGKKYEFRIWPEKSERTGKKTRAGLNQAILLETMRKRARSLLRTKRRPRKGTPRNKPEYSIPE